MFEVPVVQRLILSQYRQFRYCDLPLAHPETGQPLQQVCLLGANGAGKSSVLHQLYRAFQFLSGNPGSGSAGRDDSLVLVGVQTSEGLRYLAMAGSGEVVLGESAFWFKPGIETSPDWGALPRVMPGFEEFADFFREYTINDPDEHPHFAPPTALSYFSPGRWTVNSEPLLSFQGFLQKQRADRQRQYHEFLNREENRKRTVDEVELEFQKEYPGVLFALAELWQETLAANFITFRPGYEPPFRCEVTGDDLEFSSLASGLRRYLLGTAQLYAQFFLHPEYSGVLFLETPEAGLHPSLVATLMAFYQGLVSEHPGQLFVETHSEDIAGHFPPEARFHLHFDRENGIHATTDYVPRPKEPKSSKERSRKPVLPSRSPRVERLRRAIQATADQDELADLIDEVISLKQDRKS